MPIYHKLVRDRIPDIICASGKTCVCRTLDEAEYLERLEDKLQGELTEYMESKSMEELADLLEVMSAVAKARGSCLEEVDALRRAKAAARGGFDGRVLLEEVSPGRG